MRLYIKNEDYLLKRLLIRLLFNAFKIIHWQHFGKKAWNGKPYYNLIAIRGFRTATVDNFCGDRSTNIFYWKIGNVYIPNL